MVVRVNKQKLIMEEVETFDSITPEDLAEGACHLSLPPEIQYGNRQPIISELPENSPRYVILSYELNHRDGRKSFPLVLINWAPSSSEIGMLTLHASAFLDFQTQARSQHLHHVLAITLITGLPFSSIGRCKQSHRDSGRRGDPHEGGH